MLLKKDSYIYHKIIFNINLFIMKRVYTALLVFFYFFNNISAQTITTQPIAGSPFCGGDSVKISYTITGAFNAGNNFIAQLSDASGSFVNSTILGLVVSQTAGTINAVIPPNSTIGTKFRIRVISTSPIVLGSNNGTDLTISVTFKDLPAEACSNMPLFSMTPLPSGGAFSGSGTVSGTNFYSPSSVGAGSYIVTYTHLGCSVKQSITVVAATSVSYSGLNATYCTQDPAAILLGTPKGGVFSGSGVINSMFVPSLAGAGNFTISYTHNGCLTDATNPSKKTVDVYDSPSPNLGADKTVCKGDSVTLTASNGVDGYTWSWSPGAGSSNLQTIKVAPTITTTYFVTAKASSCNGFDTIIVNVNPLPAADAGLDKTVCFGYRDTLKATGGISYSWSTGSTNQNLVINPTITANYWVIVTDLNGCKKADTVKVTVQDPISVDIGLDKTICSGSTTSLTATPSGGSAYTYTWSTIESTQVINVSPASTQKYFVTVNSAKCSALDSIAVNVNSIPQVDAGIDTALCLGDSILISASLVSAPVVFSGYTYKTTSNGHYYYLSNNQTIWTTAKTNAEAYGGHLVTIKDATENTLVSGINPGVRMWIGFTDQLLEGTWTWITGETSTYTNWNAGEPNNSGDEDYALINWTGTGWNDVNNASSYYSIMEYEPLKWDNNSTYGSRYVKPATTTKYKVTVTYGGCTSLDSVTVTVKPLPIASAGPDLTICRNSSDTLRASGGGTYKWTGGGTNAKLFVNPIIQTTYVVTVTGTNSCSAKDTAVVFIQYPTVDAGKDTSLCKGDSIKVTATGATTYSWSNGKTGTTVWVYPLLTTTYIVTGTDNKSCTNTDNIVVYVNNPPVPNAGIDKTICKNDSATITVSGGTALAIYSWAPATGLGSVNTATVKASPASTTTYIVTLTDGCSAKDTVIVNVTALPVIAVSANRTSICENDTTLLTASSVGATAYAWSSTPVGAFQGATNIASPIAKPTANTTYKVTVTGANPTNCTNTATIVITVKANPVVDAIKDSTICEGSTIAITGTPNGATKYSWSHGATTQTASVTPLVSTKYILYVTATNGCSSKDSLNVTVNPIPAAYAGPDQTICIASDSITLTATPNGGTYSWNTGSTIQSIKVKPTNLTTYTNYIVSVTKTGCSKLDTVRIYVQAALVAQINGKNAGDSISICSGDTAYLTATGGSRYKWSTSVNDTIALLKVKPATRSTYTVTVLSGACSATSNIIVKINSKPVVDAGTSKTICFGESTNLLASGTGTAYFWAPSAGLSNVNIPNPIASPILTTKYFVTSTLNGCTAKDFVNVNINALPVIDAGKDTNVCFGKSINLTAIGGPNYLWETNATTATITVSPIVTKYYKLTVTNPTTLCKNYDSVLVTLNSLPIANATGSSTICQGGSTTITANNANSYTWVASIGTNPTSVKTPTVTPTITTTYSLTITNANGCVSTNSSTVIVSVDASITPSISSDATANTICSGSSVNIAAGGGISYNWNTSPVKTTSSINETPTITTTYLVTVSSGSCSGIANIVINVNPIPVAATAGIDQTICEGESAVLTASGANNYTWSNNDSVATTTVTPATTTTYGLTATNNFNCSKTDEIVVNVFTMPSADAGIDQTVCNSSATLIAKGGSNYLWSTAETNDTIIVTPLTNTTFVVTVSMAGCSATDDVVVSYMSSINPYAGADQYLCVKCTTGVNLTASAGSTYSWTTTETTKSINVSPIVNTTYIVTIYAGACSGTDDVAVFISPNIVASAYSNVTLTLGDSVKLSASGGSHYSWSPSTTLNSADVQSPVATPIASITYTVSVYNIHNCFETQNVIVTVSPTPVASAGADAFICPGANTQLMASGGVFYTWNSSPSLSDTSINNPIASPIVTTTYIVTVNDSAGLIGVDSVVVFVPSAGFAANAGADQTICIDDATILNGSGGQYYSWSPTYGLDNSQLQNPTVTPALNITYILTVTDINGCTDIDDVIVKINKDSVLYLGTDIALCNYDTITIDANVGSKYLWSNNDTTRAIKVYPNMNSNYRVTVWHNSGCSASDEIMVIVNPLPVAYFLGLDSTYCINDNTDILLRNTVNGVLTGNGISGYLYIPSQAGVGVDSVKYSVDSMYISKASIFYDDFNVERGWTGIDSNYTDSKWERGKAIASIACSGSADPSTDATGDSKGYILGNRIGSCYDNNLATTYYVNSPIINCTGADNIHLRFKRNAGCEGNTWDNMNIDVFNGTAWTTIFKNDLSNFNDTDWVSVVYDVNNYAKNNPNFQVRFGIGPTDSNEPFKGWNIDDFEIYGYINNNCSNYDTAITEVFDMPTVTAGNDTAICKGDTASLIAIGSVAGVYTWSTGENAQTIKVAPTKSTFYYVTITENNCIDIDTMLVTVNKIPQLEAGSDITICNGQTANIVATSDAPVLWNTGHNTTNYSIAPVITTMYYITATNVYNCVNNDSINVVVNSLPTTNAGLDDTICLGQTTTLTATGGVNYVWDNGIITNTMDVTPLTTKTYIVTSYSAEGCSSLDSVIVIVNTLPLANAGIDKQICLNDSVMIIANPGFSYIWSNGITNDTIYVKPIASEQVKVTVTDLNNCQNFDSVFVTVNTLPSITYSNDTTICLNETITFKVNADTVYSYNWNEGSSSSSITVTPLANSFYTVTVTNGNACTSTHLFSVNVNALPLITVSNDTTICKFDSAYISATGAGSILWSTTETANSIYVKPNITSNYIAQLTDINACKSYDTVVVTVNGIPLLNAGSDITVCKNTPTVLTAIGVGDFLWSTAETNPSINIMPIIDAKYTVSLTDGNGCTNTDEINIVVLELPIANAGIDQTICIGTNTSLTATGGISYKWNNSINNQVNYVNPLVNTTYIVTVTDVNNCSEMDDVVITVNPLPLADAGLNDTVCLGVYANLNATGGISYKWSTGHTTPSISLNPTVSTKYFVTVMDNNNCKNIDSAWIIVKPLPQINAGNNVSICNGQSYKIISSVNEVVTYNWSDPITLSDITIPDPIATPIASTTYTLTVTNNHNCISTDDVVIEVVDLPLASAGADVYVCINNMFDLSASGGIEYLWNTGDTTKNITKQALVNTDYVVTVVNEHGCKKTDTVSIFVNQLPLVEAGSDLTVCYGDLVNLLATGASNYAWSNGVNTDNNDFTATISSKYFVTGTDANGCYNVDSLTLTVNPLPIVNAGNNLSICYGKDITLKATGGIVYNWSPAGTLSAPTDSITIAAPIVSTNYVVTVTDINNCSNTDDILVTVNNLPVANAGLDLTICRDEKTIINTDSTGFLLNNYQWYPSTGLSSAGIYNPVAKPNFTTTYILTVTNNYGCTSIDSVIVNVNIPTVFNLPADKSICSGDGVQLIANGVANITYNWTPAIGLDNYNNDTVFANPALTTKYIVVGTDVNACTYTDDVVVTVNPKPYIYVYSDDNKICKGFATSLIALGDAVYYSWNNGVVGQNITVSPDTTTLYTVTAVNAYNCVNNYSYTINVDTLPIVVASVDDTICYGEKVAISATGGIMYSWAPSYNMNFNNIQSPIVSPLTTSIYYVTATDVNGCTAADNMTINVKPLPIPNITQDKYSICLGDSVLMVVNGGTDYVWNNASTNDSIYVTPTANTTYSVTATTNACTAKTFATVTVNKIPVAFAGIDKTINLGESTTLNANINDNYLWSTFANTQSIYVTPTTTTTYSLKVWSNANCYSVEDTATVFVINNVPVSAGANKTICFGDYVEIGSNGISGISYDWSPNIGIINNKISNPTVYPSVTTTYTVSAEFAGSTSTATVVVTVNPLPTTNTTKNIDVCLNSSVNISATGGSLYTWSPSYALTYNDTAYTTASPLVNTTYMVTITNVYSCSAIDFVIVNVLDLPNADAGFDKTLCYAQTDTLFAIASNGLAPYSYKWIPSEFLNNNYSDTVLITPLKNSSYILSITDANGCTDNDTIIVNINAPIAVNNTPYKILCFADSSNLSATLASKYTWSTGDSTQTINVKPTTNTTYFLTLTDVNGCTARDMFNVNVTPENIISFNVLDSAYCIDALEVNLEAYPVGGIFTGNGVFNDIFNPTNAGVGTSIVEYAFDTTYLNKVKLFYDDFSSERGWTGYGYGGWERKQAQSSPCGATDFDADNSVENMIIGTYIGQCYDNNIDNTYYLTSPEINCTDATNVNISFSRFAGWENNSYDKFVVQAWDGVDWVNVYANNNDLKDNKWTYQNFNLATIADGNAQFKVRFGIGTTDYQTNNIGWYIDNFEVRGIVQNTCYAKAYDTVKVVDLPIVNAGIDATICIGNETTLKASGATQYFWSNSIMTDTNTVSPDTTTQYMLKGINAYGCVNFDSVIVNVNPLPIANAGLDTTVCPEMSASLTATGGIMYYWNTLEITQSITVTPSEKTTYIVTVEDANTCSSVDTVIVNLFPLPKMNAGTDYTICIGDSITINNNSIGYFNWTPSASLNDDKAKKPIAKPASTTTYTLKVTDGNACTATDDIIVNVNPLPIVTVTTLKPVICFGDTNIVTATGGKFYSWSNGYNKDSFWINPDSTIKLDVTVTDSNKCVNYASINVIVQQLPIVDAGVDQQLCMGDSVTLQANGAKTYVWSTLDVTQTIKVSPILNTTYVVVGSDSLGCSSYDQVIVYALKNPIAYAGEDDSICVGGTYILKATGGNTYTWSTGAKTIIDTIKPLASNTYTLTVYDANSCSATDDVAISTISISNPLIAIDGATEFCEGTKPNLTLSVEDKYYKYHWSSGSTTPVVKVEYAGKYFVEVSDINGLCKAVSDTIIVDMINKPIANFTHKKEQLDVEFLNLSKNNTSSYWDFGNGTTIDGTENPNMSYSQEGDYNVMLVASNVCGNDTVYRLVKLSSVGIADANINGEKINIYPNPSDGKFIVNIQTNNNKTLNIKITDITGRIIENNDIEVYNGKDNIKQYNLNNLNNGVYLINIVTENTAITKQVIIQR